uniref:Ribonuclease VapC n=1 Tax=Caulobacter sp. (strain K31) TaxID=366602 RepID=B0SZV9_CAUSK
MTIVVDASVALKWVLDNEDGSSRAISLIETESLIAPDLWLIECANVLVMKARRGLITAEGARAALASIEATPVRIVPTRAHIAAAQAIAFELNKSAYDSLYLAIAVSERATMVTADAAFFRAASATAAYAPHIRML